MRDFTTILEGVLSAAASRLNIAGRAPGRVVLTPGTLPAWDDCCDGQLYLRVIDIYPTAGYSSPFPQLDAAQRGAGSLCGIHLLAVHIGLGVIRCAAVVDDDGTAPPPAAISADADEMLQDMSTLLDALVCDAQGVDGVMLLKMDRWMPQGVEGGCHGGEWGAYLAVDPCVCRGDEPA